MIRRLRAAALVVVLFAICCAPVSIALAATSANITVTAIGFICEAPGLTVTYISDYEVEVSWIKGVGAENTVVKATIGREPTGRDDGYTVYYGEDSETTDWVNMETLSVPIYYKAYSQNPSGIWEEQGSNVGLVEGLSMTLIALIVLALGFTISGYVLKRGVLAFAAAGCWIILFMYSLNASTSSWDIFYSLAWVSLGLAITSLFATLTRKDTSGDTDEQEEEDPDVTETRREMAAAQREQQQYSFLWKKKR